MKKIRNILLVEAEEELLNVVSITLKGRGYNVFEAHNAQEAIDALKTSFMFHLLVTDLGMSPGMSGFELIKHIRSEGNELPVVLCSGDYPELERLGGEIKKYGIVVVRKPYESEVLFAAIDQVAA